MSATAAEIELSVADRAAAAVETRFIVSAMAWAFEASDATMEEMEGLPDTCGNTTSTAEIKIFVPLVDIFGSWANASEKAVKSELDYISK